MTRCPARKRTRGKEPLWYFSFVFWGPRDSWVWPLAVNTKKRAPQRSSTGIARDASWQTRPPCCDECNVGKQKDEGTRRDWPALIACTQPEEAHVFRLPRDVGARDVARPIPLCFCATSRCLLRRHTKKQGHGAHPRKERTVFKQQNCYTQDTPIFHMEYIVAKV